MLRSDHSAFSCGLPFTRLAWLALGLVTAALALGCTPKIGDKCTVSTNCSTTGDRLCDVTQPEGYCTKFNCEPGKCPEDSVCVNFGTRLAQADGCQASQGNSPYKRSFCMANCSSDDDCRAGYRCLEPKNFAAVLAEDSSGQKVCAVPLPDKSEGGGGAGGNGGGGGAGGWEAPGVCTGSDAGPPEGGSSSSGGASGAAQGGSSSVGGSAGAAGDNTAGDGGAGG